MYGGVLIPSRSDHRTVTNFELGVSLDTPLLADLPNPLKVHYYMLRLGRDAMLFVVLGCHSWAVVVVVFV